MKYDVFISYSRKDFDEVSAIKERIEREIPGIKIWFDIDGIESGDEFVDKTISAIDDSEQMLFALSDNSNGGKWTKKEIMYAKNTEKRVIPVLLRNAKLKGWFLFEFGRIDCIDSTNEQQMAKLIRNLAAKSGRKCISSEQSTPKPEPNKPNHVVDLGLSVYWADCNVGANSPEEYGDYFAWGEIRPKNSYNYNNSETFDKEISWLRSNDYIDGSSLTMEHDAAHANWGGSWRMPTKGEFDELIDKCKWEWTTYGGKKGYKVTGPNGNSIFLPVAGWRSETSLIDAGEGSSYWSSSPDGRNTCYAWMLHFYGGGQSVNSYYRYFGYAVRPVLDK